MAARDLTFQQFLDRAKALGFTPEGFMGYYRFDWKQVDPDASGATCTSILNAGLRRRDRLAYLAAEKRGIVARAEADGVETRARRAAKATAAQAGA